MSTFLAECGCVILFRYQKFTIWQGKNDGFKRKKKKEYVFCVLVYLESFSIRKYFTTENSKPLSPGSSLIAKMVWVPRHQLQGKLH